MYYVKCVCALPICVAYFYMMMIKVKLNGLDIYIYTNVQCENETY